MYQNQDMRPESWIESLLGNRWRVRVLRRLLREPARIWTEREMARALEASPNTIHVAVGKLLDEGVLEFRRLGPSNTFRLRQDLDLVRRLHEIFRLESSSMDDVKAAIRAASPAGAECILFGSTVRSEAQDESDVDLLVIAPTSEAAEDAAEAVRCAAAAVMPLRLSILALSERQVAQRRKAKEPWLMNALAEGERISAGDRRTAS